MSNEQLPIIVAGANGFSQEQVDAICKLAEDFDYSLLVNDHVNGVKDYHGSPLTNYAESTQLDKSIKENAEAAAYMRKRFRGYYPVIIDIETTGTDFHRNSIIQIAAVALTFNANKELVPYAELKLNVHPLADKEIAPASLLITGINPFDHQRKAVSLETALTALCKFARGAQKAHGCQRSIITAHNVNFDASFIYHYIEQCKIKRSPFHPFLVFDTAVLGGMFLGETRLHYCMQKLFPNQLDISQAHDALFDAYLCAKLFAHCVNTSNILAEPYLEDLNSTYD